MSIIDAMALGFLTTVAFPKLPPLLLSGIFYVGLSPANDSFNVIFPSDLKKRKQHILSFADLWQLQTSIYGVLWLTIKLMSDRNSLYIGFNTGN